MIVVSFWEKSLLCGHKNETVILTIISAILCLPRQWSVVLSLRSTCLLWETENMWIHKRLTDVIAVKIIIVSLIIFSCRNLLRLLNIIGNIYFIFVILTPKNSSLFWVIIICCYWMMMNVWDCISGVSVNGLVVSKRWQCLWSKCVLRLQWWRWVDHIIFSIESVITVVLRISHIFIVQHAILLSFLFDTY